LQIQVNDPPESVNSIGTSRLTAVHSGIVVILASESECIWILRLGVRLTKPLGRLNLVGMHKTCITHTGHDPCKTLVVHIHLFSFRTEGKKNQTEKSRKIILPLFLFTQ